MSAFTAVACSDATPTASSLEIPAVDASLAASAAEPRLMELAGQRIFEDTDLSLRRNQSCATCHDEAFGFSSPNAQQNAHGSVLPGSIPTRFGSRRSPMAAYSTFSPVFGYNAEDDGFIGGNFWNGRATGARLGNPRAEQALEPFLDPTEQALPDLAGRRPKSRRT